MAKYRYVVRDGKQYVAYTDTNWSTPVEITRYWPVGSVMRSGGMFRPLEDIETDFEVRADGANFRSAGGWLILLKDGGKTRPDFAEERDLLPPKTKLQTEYRDGAWYKILKSGKKVQAEGIRDEKGSGRRGSAVGGRSGQ